MMLMLMVKIKKNGVSWFYLVLLLLSVADSRITIVKMKPRNYME